MPRTPLNRERVLRAAVAFADQHGIASVSMRKLGESLGVEAMSLYAHVTNKDELLDEMVDAVFGEISEPADDPDWRIAMRQRAVSAREVLSGHPWAIGLMESRSSPGTAALRHHEAVLRCLREAGFSVELAAHALAVLDSYVYGFALQEANLPFDPTAGQAQHPEAVLAKVPPDEYPYLSELAGLHVLQPGYDYDDEYAFGLSLLFESLEGVRTSGAWPTSHVSPA